MTHAFKGILWLAVMYHIFWVGVGLIVTSRRRGKSLWLIVRSGYGQVASVARRKWVPVLFAVAGVSCVGTAAEAQEGWISDPLNPQLVAFRWEIHTGDWNNGVAWVGTITPLVEPISGNISSPITGGGILASGNTWGENPYATNSRAGNVTTSWSTSVGANMFLYIGGSDGYAAWTTAPNFATPLGTNSNVGYYALTIGLWHGDTNVTNYHTTNMWCVNGSWTTNPPTGQYIPQTQPGINYGSASSSGVDFQINWSNAGTSASGTVAGAKLQITGPMSASATANSSGFYGPITLSIGQYEVGVVSSTHTDGGATINDAGQAYFAVDGTGNPVHVVVHFADTTGQSSSRLDSINGLNTSLTNPGGTGLIQSALQTLFIPQPSSLTNLQTNLSTLENWGPFGMITTFASILSTPANNTGYVVQIPQLYIQSAGGGMSGQPVSWTWQANTGNETQLYVQDMSGVPAFTFMRGLMGFAVYFGFVMFAIKFSVPRLVF